MTKYKTIGQTTYAYSMVGNEDGEPLVLLHGFTGTKETWQQFIKQAGATYHIVTIDLPGHGRTVAKERVTMEQFVDDLHELTRYIRLYTFHLLGYSLGGRSALSYALRYPKTIQSLILESSSPGLRTEEERDERIAADKKLAEMIVNKGLQYFVAYWEDIPLFATQKRLDEATKKAIRHERLSQSEAGLAQSLLGMGTGAQPSWWEDVKAITFPLLLIVGALDEKFIDINEKIAEKVQTSKLHVVADAGHAVHIEKNAEFAQVVLDYIDKK